ncbi:4Fe-4S dicluster domain-containing protein [Geobacter benzoatilyticus]|uniref:4Fe-4S dicluster domain-containing protein n=1 Tax=Geobacter benzoatilyticus TaxID=2815309 RepID=A0ABX7Q2S4_9BACT|nr:4Fe-4S dicluster domain-containing protein [Geobacter benzoatilyticus]QSV45497.1 4Fe-4S dicluster domain-containing protein [Geobacter benzoatilyticus]
MKRIFVDYKKCLACKACETACAVEHHPGGTLLAALGDRKTEVNVRVLGIDQEAFPLSCRHCDPAECLDACPSGALGRDPESGAVILDPALCKACAMCAMVCPFDAISFKATHRAGYGRDVAHKCDLCTDRVKAGGQPACVEACHSGALVFAEYEATRTERAVKGLRHYLLGLEGLPPHVELFRELRRKEFARRRGGEE